MHAGKYIVRFVYGDEYEKFDTTDGNTIKYSGQDYQSTKYTVIGDGDEASVIEATEFAELSGNTVEFNNGEPEKGKNIYSVAKDNEIRRLEVNAYSTTTTYPMDSVLKAKNNTEESKLLAEHTAMFADTKTFNMQIEYFDDDYTDKDSKKISGTLPDDHYNYSVRDVNFGLIERPKAKLQLMNDITEIKAITSDGKTLIDLPFDIIYEKVGNEIKHTAVPNYENSIGNSEVQILNRNGDNQGFRYANIDNDILQGMTIVLKFRIAIANNSEVDHLSSWLEEAIENESKVDLNIKYLGNSETKTTYNDLKITDRIRKEERNYNYSNSYLYKLLYEGEDSLVKADNGVHNYGGNTDKIGSENIKKAYTYTNIKKKVDNNYKTGYYLGNIYYYNDVKDEKYGNEVEHKVVETRVDQFIDYVDNDLIFKPEENKNENNQTTYLTYKLDEIAAKGLLKEITPDTKSISDGEREYCNKTKNKNNNLAFNIEDENINKDLYKFLSTIPEDAYTEISETEINYDYNKDGAINGATKITTIGNNNIKDNLYIMDLQASKILTSEVGLEGIEIENLAEIVKATNTAGRKIYVKSNKAESKETGNIGNTTKDPIASINREKNSKTMVEISKSESDTDFTEYVTFSPPTGLTKKESETKDKIDKLTDALLIVVPVIIIISGVSYVTVQFIKKKKFYK